MRVPKQKCEYRTRDAQVKKITGYSLEVPHLSYFSTKTHVLLLPDNGPNSCQNVLLTSPGEKKPPLFHIKTVKVS